MEDTFMDFGRFIAAFGAGYRKLIDPDTNKALSKPLFCRYLLCSITTDINNVIYIDRIQDKKHERSESAFQAFYRNNDRRSLHPIAESILNRKSLDKSKFMFFLEEYCNNYPKEKLLKDFKRYIPSTSYSTLFEDITDAFVSILEKAAAEPDNRLKEPVSTEKLASHNSNNNSVEAQINSLLRELIITGRKIAEFKKTGTGDDIKYRRLRTKLHDDFEQLISLSELLADSQKAENSQIIEEILDSATRLEESNFILTTYEFMIESVKNYNIHRLSDLIAQLQQGL